MLPRLGNTRCSVYDSTMDRHEITVREAAALLGLDVSQVRRRIQAGHLPARRVGMRLWLIPRTSVEAAAKIGRIPPGPKSASRRLEQQKDDYQA